MLRRLLPLIFLFLLSSSAYACGYLLLGEEYRIALLNPYLIGEEYSTFFYSSERFKHWKTEKSGRDRLLNTDLWAQELGGSITGAEVGEILYNTDLDDWLRAVDNPTSGPFVGNSAWEAISKRPALLEYALYAKGYEKESEIKDYWAREDEDEANKSPYRLNFRERAEAGYAAAKRGSFLKERYGYQLLLLAYYREDSEAMEQYFNAHFKNQSGPLADWARFHFAGEWNEAGRYVVEMANAFRRVPEKAFAALQRTKVNYNQPYRPEDYLGAAKTDAERSNLYALAAVQRSGYALEYLKKAYELDPTNPIIELLLVREMNKLEDWLMTYELTYLNPTTSSIRPEGRSNPWEYDSYEEWEKVADQIRKENYQRDQKHLKKLRNFLNQYAPANQQFAAILRAQAALLGEDFSEALAYVEQYPATDDAFGQQIATIRYLATVQLPGIAPAERSQAIAAALPLLEAPFGEYDNRRGVPARLASQVYAEVGDTVTAYLLYNRSLPLPAGSGWASEYYQQLDYLDRTISEETMQRIIGLLEGGQPENKAQRMLVATGEDYLPNVITLHDLAGTLALRRNDLPTALAHFAKIPPSAKGNHGRDDRKFSPLSDVVGKQIRLTSKADVVRQMLAMEAMTGTGGDAAAAACLTLATAWYNMSDLGSSWWMLRYGYSTVKPRQALPWPHSGQHRATPHTKFDYDLMYLASRADEYLDCAEANVADEELSTRIAFLRVALKKGRLNFEFQANNNWGAEEEDVRRLQENTDAIMQPFVDRYRNSDYFQEIKGSCLVVGAYD